MSSIVYRTINGTKYAYSSESYWDRDKKAPRTKRRYLGKVDPESGEIIRVYKKSERTEKTDIQTAEDLETLEAMSSELAKLKEEVQRLTELNATLMSKFMTVKEVIDSFP